MKIFKLWYKKEHVIKDVKTIFITLFGREVQNSLLHSCMYVKVNI